MCWGWGSLIWALSGKDRFIFKLYFSPAFLMAVCVLVVAALALGSTAPAPCALNYPTPLQLWAFIFAFIILTIIMFYAILCWCLKPWNLRVLCLPAGTREVGSVGADFWFCFFPSDTLLLGFCHCFHFLLKHQRLGRVWGDVRRSSFMPDWLILIHMI